MSGFFDDLVGATTADGPVDALTSGSAPVDRQAVRTGAVLASAAVVSELARLADGGSRWTWQRLVRSGTAGADGPDNPERSVWLIRTLFGERAASVADVIARDAGLAPAAAERVLRSSTETAVSLLADRVAAGAQPDLRVEAETLAASGWGDWLTALAPVPVSGPATAEPSADDTAPAVVALEPEEDPAPLAAAPPPEPVRAPEPVGAPGPPAAPGPATAAPLDVEDGERPSRRLLVAGAVTVAAVALLALAVSTRFGGGSVDGGGTATSPTTAAGPESTDADAGADLATGTTTGPTSANPATTAPLVPATAAPDPAAPLAPATYQLALADPKGSTDTAGTARIDVDPTTGRICYQFDVAGLTDPFPGHIHAAPTGTSGGITVDFGYLTGATPSGCVDSFPADAADIVRHPERHYLELHDTEYGFGIRSRLAEEAPGAPALGSGTTDDGADTAAVTVLRGARVVLRGAVPDEATRTALVAGTADLAAQGFEVVDELTVEAGAPPPSGRVLVEESLLFPFDSNQLPDDTARTVDQLARILQLRPQWRVTLVGNTDGLGDVVYNLTLSLRRAIAARDALVAAGVPPDAVTIRGDGPFAPVADNATPDGRSRNRRIDVVITAAP